MEEQVLSIKDIGNILIKRLSMIIVITLITTIGAIGLTYFVIEPTYTTSVTLLIGKVTDSENGTSYSSGDVSLYKQLMGTYAKVVKSEDLIERAIKRGKLNLTVGQVLGSLVVSPGTQDQILTLTYNSKNPNEGVEVLNPLVEEFKETSSKIISNGEIFLLTAPKIPKVPSSPNNKMNIMLGVALGIAVGISLALFLEYIDDSVKTSGDIEYLLGIPVIGNIPIYGEKWGSLSDDLGENQEKKKHKKHSKK